MGKTFSSHKLWPVIAHQVRDSAVNSNFYSEAVNRFVQEKIRFIHESDHFFEIRLLFTALWTVTVTGFAFINRLRRIRGCSRFFGL